MSFHFKTQFHKKNIWEDLKKHVSAQRSTNLTHTISGDESKFQHLRLMPLLSEIKANWKSEIKNYSVKSGKFNISKPKLDNIDHIYLFFKCHWICDKRINTEINPCP